jgi:hypothetical protein
MKTNWKQAIVFFAIFTTAIPASADGEYERFHDSFRVYLGGFWPTINSEILINGDVLPPGTIIDVEDLLSVTDSKGAAWGGVAWHFANRHSMEFEHFSLDREGGTDDTFSPPIQFGDSSIESGAINTAYNTSLSRLTYGFSLTRSERAEFQLKAGLHVAKLEAGVQLAGQICDPSTVPTEPPNCPPLGTAVASEDVTAPLPHFGAAFTYAMTPTLALSLQAIGFGVKIDSIEGSIFELDADVAWQPWRHFGVGAGLRYFKTSVKGGNSELDGEFNFEYLGPTLYIHATF